MRNKKLVIIEFGAHWQNCNFSQEDMPKQIKQCKKEEQQKKVRIDAFVDKVVKDIKFTKVNG